MANVFFVGDLHLGHRNVVRFRPFNTWQAHDEFVIQQWNDRVRNNDVVWIMGDASFTTDREYAVTALRRLKGQKKVVLGNHDDPVALREAGIIHQYGLIKKYGYWLSHAPIHPAELRGALNIHGHVHHATLPDKRYLNVSLEAIGYAPYSLNEVREKLNGGFVV